MCLFVCVCVCARVCVCVCAIVIFEGTFCLVGLKRKLGFSGGAPILAHPLWRLSLC